MKRLKRILALLLVLVLACGLVPAALAVLPAEPAAAGDVAINATNFPDGNFRYYISKNCDSDHNGVLSTTEQKSVEEIRISVDSSENLDYDDLKGIEHFTELTALYMYRIDQDWELNMDLSKNTKLTVLGCAYNYLKSLDISKNTALRRLYCKKNAISNLDLRSVPGLNWLVGYYQYNQIAPTYIYEISGTYVIYSKGEYSLNVDSGTKLTVTLYPFTDVKEGKYYFEPVYWAYYHDPQITSGTSATLFGTSNDCTRAQIVTFLWKAAGAPEPTSTYNPFSDVQSTKYYYKAVLWAVQKGITSGVDPTHFGVNQPCTREQAMTFLWKYAGAPNPGSSYNPFTDVKPGKWYEKAILWAVQNGVTSGVSSNKFGVGQPCTRAQIVTFLYKLPKG